MNYKNKYTTYFDKTNAPKAHNETIQGGRLISEGIKTPFNHAWGYIEGAGMMEEHSHPTDEVYIVIKGRAFCTIDGERFEVVPGDVIEIPPNAVHSVECMEGEEFLWAAIFWRHID